MNILYEGMLGAAANPTLGWSLIIGAVVILIVGIILGCLDIFPEGLVVFIMGVTIGAIILGILNLVDNRIPIVKAIFNDPVSYEEIESKYKLRTHEGELYTFEVKNVTPDEWQQHLDE